MSKEKHAIPMPGIDASWYRRPTGVPAELSAGGLVGRVAGDAVWLALARQHGYAGFVLPKGHIGPFEDPEAAARREIAEEAGFVQLDCLHDFGTRERLDYRKTVWKITRYFLFATREIEVVPQEQEHHDPPKWMALDETAPMIWPEQRDIILLHRERIRQALLSHVRAAQL
jgi:8-oxo-dGTP pyrophosphatase MutT (NUDIX family)